MSDINLDFTVSNNSINFTVEPNDITFTPEDVQLNIYAGGIGVPGGSIEQVQFNAGNVLNGSSNLTYSTSTGITSALQLNTSTLIVAQSANLGSVSNITITGGVANAVLTTDGSGTLTWGNSAANANYANIAGVAYSVDAANVVGTVANANYAAYAGNVTIAAQSNITSLGTLTGLNISGVSNLGPIGNVRITGGTNGYVLQTDGTGNLAWTAQTGGSGNGAPGGANTQIQFNDAGVFGGNAGFTFDKTTGNIALPNNISIAGNINTVTNITTTGNITTNNITAGNVNSSVTLPYGIEKLSLISAQTGTYNFDLISNAINYTTSNASANLTLNFRGNSSISANTLLANGQSITGTYVFKTGSTPYGVTALQVDGSAQTIKWASNVVPLQVANTLTSYVFTIVKTSTTPTYDVLASATRYG
jgi:hypothetical protein